MLIEVTQQDIENGKQKDCRNCPIALAITRSLPEATYVSVQEKAVWLRDENDKEYFKIYQLPLAAQDFIRDFDRDVPVQPFNFELRGI